MMWRAYVGYVLFLHVHLVAICPSQWRTKINPCRVLSFKCVARGITRHGAPSVAFNGNMSSALAIHRPNAAFMEYHPIIYSAYHSMRRQGATTMCLPAFAATYGSTLVPKESIRAFTTISVHLNPSSSVGTRVTIDPQNVHWYDHLCSQLGVASLSYRGKAIRDIALTHLHALQPIRPQFSASRVRMVSNAPCGPCVAPDACRPGAYERKHQQFTRLATAIAARVANHHVHAEDWSAIKALMRNTRQLGTMVQHVAHDQSVVVDARHEAEFFASLQKAVGAHRGVVLAFKALQERSRILAEDTPEADSLDRIGAHSSSFNDGLSDDEEDASFLGSSVSARAKVVPLNKHEQQELSAGPAHITQLITHHLLTRSHALRKSFLTITHGPSVASAAPSASPVPVRAASRTKMPVMAPYVTAASSTPSPPLVTYHGEPKKTVARRVRSALPDLVPSSPSLAPRARVAMRDMPILSAEAPEMHVRAAPSYQAVHTEHITADLPDLAPVHEETVDIQEFYVPMSNARHTRAASPPRSHHHEHPHKHPRRKVDATLADLPALTPEDEPEVASAVMAAPAVDIQSKLMFLSCRPSYQLFAHVMSTFPDHKDVMAIRAEAASYIQLENASTFPSHEFIALKHRASGSGDSQQLLSKFTAMCSSVSPTNVVLGVHADYNHCQFYC